MTRTGNQRVTGHLSGTELARAGNETGKHGAARDPSIEQHQSKDVIEGPRMGEAGNLRDAHSLPSC